MYRKSRSRADQDVLRIHPHSRKAARWPAMACRSSGTPWLGRARGSASPKSSITSRCKRPDGKGELLRAVGGQVKKAWLRPLRAPRADGGHWGAMLHRLHKITHLLLRADVALGQQLAVGGLHGDLADLQILRQRPLGGQLLQDAAPGQDIPRMQR